MKQLLHTNVFNENRETKMVYHKTVVAKFDHEKITLNSGGFQTATTKRRMNQFSEMYSLGYRVFQEDYCWYVDYKDEIFIFKDGMELMLW